MLFIFVTLFVQIVHHQFENTHRGKASRVILNSQRTNAKATNAKGPAMPALRSTAE